MTPLLMQVQSLQRQADARAGQIPERILTGLERLDLIVNHFIRRATTLLDVSRLTSGLFRLEPAETDLSALVRAVAARMEPHADRSGSPINLDVADGITGLLDPVATEQIVDNLLSNAIKYGEGQPIDLSLQQQGVHARLQVRDRGIGISEDNRQRIFDRFERAIGRAEHSGFGVGLWVVGRLTSEMNGTIEIESETGSGTTFTVLLPLSQQSRDV
jgi:signal transduction histidine kinase